MQQDARPGNTISDIDDHRFALSALDPTMHAYESIPTTESSAMRRETLILQRLVDSKPLLLLGFVHEPDCASAHQRGDRTKQTGDHSTRFRSIAGIDLAPDFTVFHHIEITPSASAKKILKKICGASRNFCKNRSEVHHCGRLISHTTNVVLLHRIHTDRHRSPHHRHT
jgi:hypothetical protein